MCEDMSTEVKNMKNFKTPIWLTTKTTLPTLHNGE